MHACNTHTHIKAHRQEYSFCYHTQSTEVKGELCDRGATFHLTVSFCGALWMKLDNWFTINTLYEVKTQIFSRQENIKSRYSHLIKQEDLYI